MSNNPSKVKDRMRQINFRSHFINYYKLVTRPMSQGSWRESLGAGAVSDVVFAGGGSQVFQFGRDCGGLCGVSVPRSGSPGGQLLPALLHSTTLSASSHCQLVAGTSPLVISKFK